MVTRAERCIASPTEGKIGNRVFLVLSVTPSRAGPSGGASCAFAMLGGCLGVLADYFETDTAHLTSHTFIHAGRRQAGARKSFAATRSPPTTDSFSPIRTQKGMGALLTSINSTPPSSTPATLGSRTGSGVTTLFMPPSFP